MDATQTQRLDRNVGRFAMLAGLGAVGVLLWLLAGLLFGGSAAHAETNSAPGGGVLGGVTGTVSKATGAVTGAVAKVTGAVTQTTTDAAATVTGAATRSTADAAKTVTVSASQTAQKATTTVEKPPVAGRVAAPVVDTAQRAVKTVATKVAEPALASVVGTVKGGVVEPVVAPVVDLVTGLPVVGGLVTGTGIDTTLTGVAGAVDSTVGTIVGGTADVVTGTVLPGLTGDGAASGSGSGPIGGSTGPTTGTPGSTTGVVLPGASAPQVLPASAVDPAILTLTRAFTTAALMTVRDAAGVWLPSASVPAAPDGPLAGLSVSCPVGGSCSFGPSGAGAGAAGALSALAFVVAYRAWMRRRTQDDRVPHAPVYATDTSPD